MFHCKSWVTNVVLLLGGYITAYCVTVNEMTEGWSITGPKVAYYRLVLQDVETEPKAIYFDLRGPVWEGFFAPANWVDRHIRREMWRDTRR